MAQEKNTNVLAKLMPFLVMVMVPFVLSNAVDEDSSISLKRNTPSDSLTEETYFVDTSVEDSRSETSSS